MSYPSPDNNAFELPYQNNAGFDAEMAHTRKKQGGCCCFGCCLGCFGFLLLLLLGIAALWYCFFSGAVPLTVSKETTVITEPLKSDGQTIDFHQAIQDMLKPDAPPNENGFRDVLLGYGSAMFDSTDIFTLDKADTAWQYAEMCKELGIDPQTLPTLFASSMKHAATNFNQWHDQVGEGLDAVQVAAAKPHYFVPLIRRSEKDLVMMSQPFAVYAFHRDLSDALRTRAVFLFSSNKPAEGWNDTLASIRLFRRVTINQAWLETLSVGDDEDSPLLTPVTDVVDTLPRWTPELLKQAIKDLESLPDWQDRQTTLKMMQFCLLDLVSATSDPTDLQNRLRGKLPHDALEVLNVLHVIGFDWNFVAIELNTQIKNYEERAESVAKDNLDQQIERLHLRPMGESFDNLLKPDNPLLPELLNERFARQGDMSFNPLFAPGRSKVVGVIIGHLITQAAGEMYRLQLIEESRCQALRLALALEQFRRENEHYPESLNELGLKPILPDMQLQYEKQGTGYRIQNKIFKIETK